MCTTDPAGSSTPPSSVSAMTHRENIGSVGIHRTDSSMAGRSSCRSSRTASRRSGRCSSAVSVVPICFHVVPEPAPSSNSTNESISRSVRWVVAPSSSVSSACTSTLIRSSCGCSRRAPMIGLIMSTTFWGSVASAARMSSACSMGTPKLPVMVRIGMAAQKSTLSSARPSPAKPSMSSVDRLGDPVLGPPLAVGGQERRLHQSSVSLVVGTIHRQHAVGDAQRTAVDVEGLWGRSEHLGIAVGREAGLVVECGEVQAIWMRQSVDSTGCPSGR